MCTTKSRYEEYTKIQLCKYHYMKTRPTICTTSKPRQLGELAGLLVMHNTDRQCTQEVHFYLKEIFEQSKKNPEVYTSKYVRNKPILSAKSKTAPSTPKKADSPTSQRVMFSALGLPPQRQDFRRIQTVPHGATRNSNESNSHPTHLSTNHLSAPSTAYNSPRDQKVYIKLSRPTPHNFQSTPATVRKQTYRPFCLIRGDLQEQALVKNKPISAPPCSPAPRLLGR